MHIISKLRFTRALAAACALLGALCAAACATTEKIAEGIATKNVTGNGTFIRTSIGIDPDSKIPGMHTTFVSGDLATAKSGTNSIMYRSESAASIWNAQSVTRKQFVSITMTDSGDVAAVIRAVSSVLRAAAEQKSAPDPSGSAANDSAPD